jgi:hypothetical protein
MPAVSRHFLRQKVETVSRMVYDVRSRLQRSGRNGVANLNKEDYTEIARRLFELLDEYYAEYEEEMAADAAA